MKNVKLTLCGVWDPERVVDLRRYYLCTHTCDPDRWLDANILSLVASNTMRRTFLELNMVFRDHLVDAANNTFAA